MTRKRSESDAESAALALMETTRSDLWFEDGSIVVRAEKTIFRVYEGILAANSAVWKEMVSNLNSEAPLIDKCPVLCLDDTAQDVESVLKTLCHRDAYPNDEPIPIEVACAFARLGRKYEIQYLFKNGVNRLTDLLPTTVERMVDYQGSNRIVISPGFLPIVALHAAALARELDLLFLLPAALQILSDPLRLHWLCALEVPSLTYTDVQLILKRGQRRRDAFATHVYAWLEEPVPQCTSEKCGPHKTQMALKLWKGSSLQLHWKPDIAPQLCKACTTAGRRAQEAGARAYWKELPALFELPPWEELLKNPAVA
ncbi:hypothetical protein C8F01DRAFT_1155437, partial [Mycena amicta]